MAFIFLMLVTIMFGLFWAIDSGMLQSAQAALSTVAIIVVGGVFFILYIGGIAILITLHDRHRELAESVHLIADELKRIANGSGTP